MTFEEMFGYPVRLIRKVLHSEGPLGTEDGFQRNYWVRVKDTSYGDWSKWRKYKAANWRSAAFKDKYHCNKYEVKTMAGEVLGATWDGGRWVDYPQNSAKLNRVDP